MKQEQNLQKILSLTDTAIDTSWIDIEQEWSSFRDTVKPLPVIGKKPFLYRPGMLRMAAIWLLLAGTAISYLVYLQWYSRYKIVADTAVAVQSLPDGSVVTLNKRSVITYDRSYNSSNRNLELSGEAFFSVAADKQRPFTVRSGKLVVEVLGTSFNMKTADGTTEVIVETGSVKVKTDKTTMVLTAGEMVTLEQNDTALRKQQVISPLYNYYRTHTFNCKETPLKELLAALNDTYGWHLSLVNPEDGNLPITADFSRVPVDEIVPVICTTLRLSATKQGDSIRLQRLNN